MPLHSGSKPTYYVSPHQTVEIRVRVRQCRVFRQILESLGQRTGLVPDVNFPRLDSDSDFGAGLACKTGKTRLAGIE
jgi:hypothetical protein